MTKPKRLGFQLALAAVVALTVAGGVLEGHIRNRWGPSQAMQAAAQRLDSVPRQFGGPHNDSWQLKSSETMSDDTLEMLECTGNIVRTYENPRTGERVSLFVIVGPPGPIAVHTPEICYSAQNYKSRDDREQVSLLGTQGQDDQFWALTFKNKNVREDLLRVYYAWTTGNRWSAPNSAQFAYAGRPYLYKIQASCQMPAGSNLKTSDTCKEFLKEFLPVLRPHLTSDL